MDMLYRITKRILQWDHWMIKIHPSKAAVYQAILDANFGIGVCRVGKRLPRWFIREAEKALAETPDAF